MTQPADITELFGTCHSDYVHYTVIWLEPGQTGTGLQISLILLFTGAFVCVGGGDA